MRVARSDADVCYCRCRHAQQVHQPSDSTGCRGRCHEYRHNLSDHTGGCTARCTCDGYKERNR